MILFAIRRSLAMAILLLAASIVVHLLMHALPGTPASGAPAHDLARLAIAPLQDLTGTEFPLVVAYLDWLAAALQGDLGHSAAASADVAGVLLARAPVTLQLLAGSLVLALAAGIPAGVLAATRKHGIVDRCCRLLALLGESVPVFWQAMMMVLVLAIVLRWVPAGGYVPPAQDLFVFTHHILLPAVALATGSAAAILRVMRAATLEAIDQDHLLTMRASGVSHRAAFWGHALRLALVPTLAAVPAAVAQILAGTVLVETIFDLPGLGRLVVESIRARDFAPLQAAALAGAAAVVVTKLASDMLRALLDRRVRVRQ